MIKIPFFSKRPDEIAPLFGDIVAASRAPVAYLEYGIADTFEGRFERLSLIMTLVLKRLQALPAPATTMAQELVDTFFASLDDGLRRAGIGDLSVPKRMKKLAQGFYGRAEAYTSALASGEERQLREALARNLYASSVAPEAVPDAVLVEIANIEAALERRDCKSLLVGTVLQAAIMEGVEP